MTCSYYDQGVTGFMVGNKTTDPDSGRPLFSGKSYECYAELASRTTPNVAAVNFDLQTQNEFLLNETTTVSKLDAASQPVDDATAYQTSISSCGYMKLCASQEDQVMPCAEYAGMYNEKSEAENRGVFTVTTTMYCCRGIAPIEDEDLNYASLYTDDYVLDATVETIQCSYGNATLKGWLKGTVSQQGVVLEGKFYEMYDESKNFENGTCTYGEFTAKQINWPYGWIGVREVDDPDYWWLGYTQEYEWRATIVEQYVDEDGNFAGAEDIKYNPEECTVDDYCYPGGFSNTKAYYENCFLAYEMYDKCKPKPFRLAQWALIAIIFSTIIVCCGGGYIIYRLKCAPGAPGIRLPTCC